jgi:hypothetical protein
MFLTISVRGREEDVGIEAHHSPLLPSTAARLQCRAEHPSAGLPPPNPHHPGMPEPWWALQAALLASVSASGQPFASVTNSPGWFAVAVQPARQCQPLDSANRSTVPTQTERPTLTSWASKWPCDIARACPLR